MMSEIHSQCSGSSTVKKIISFLIIFKIEKEYFCGMSTDWTSLFNTKKSPLFYTFNTETMLT